MTTTDHGTGMQIWAKNLGPVRGEHLLTTIDGPGLWEIIGRNTGGKSTVGRVMLLFGEERLLSSDAAHVTDGEMNGYLYMEPARLVFSTDAAGRAQAPVRTGASALPTIEEIPHPIELLMTGGSSKQRTVKDRAVRARNRLHQLLTFAPIHADDPLLDRLCQAMDERSFRHQPTAAQAVAWDLLMAQVAADVARFQSIPPMLPDAIRAQVVDSRGKGTGSILDDQQALHKLLNRLATAAGHAVNRQRIVLGTFDGRISEAVAAAARRLGQTPSPAFQRQLEAWPGDLAELRQDLEVARQTAARIRVQHEERGAEQDRRSVLAETHGDRPTDADERQRVQDALEAFQAAETTRDWAKTAAGEIDTEKAAQDAVTKSRMTELRDAWAGWRQAAGKVDAALGSPAGPSGVQLPTPATMATLDGEVLSPVTAALGALSLAIYAAAEADAGGREIADRHTEKHALLINADRDVDLARTEQSEATRALENRTAEIRRWDEVAALIAEKIPGPGIEEVEAADAAVETVQAEIAMGEAREALLAVIAERRAEDEILDWLLNLETDYREVAAASWAHLGAIVTEHLALPWLRVDGMEMILIYDVEIGRLATDETPASRREERGIDDQKRVSTAELHEAVLKLMLDRRKTEVTGAGRSPMIILPWDYERPSAIAALDDERKARFAADVEDAGLVIFAERPSRDGEDTAVHMLKVKARRS